MTCEHCGFEATTSGNGRCVQCGFPVKMLEVYRLAHEAEVADAQKRACLPFGLTIADLVGAIFGGAIFSLLLGGVGWVLYTAFIEVRQITGG